MKRYLVQAFNPESGEWSTTIVACFIEDAEAAFLRKYPESLILKIERVRK